MRRYIFIVLVFTVIFSSSAYSANGDILGEYYYTDIKTYIYRSPITSYNIGGKTMIDAEILNWHYGFDVYWYEDKRALELTDKGGRFNSSQAMSGELCESEYGTAGETKGYYYDTDIKTFLNGNEITSCNIGGRTCISVEEMANFGYDVVWDGEKRTLTVVKPSDFYKIETDMGLIKTAYNCKVQGNFAVYERGIYALDGNDNYTEIEIPSNRVLAGISGSIYMKLSDLCSLVEGKAELREEEYTAHTEHINGMSYDDTEYSYTLSLDYGKIPQLKTKTPSEEFTSIKEYFPKNNEYYSFDFKFTVNGTETDVVSIYGGKEYRADFIIAEGELYIPVHIAAKLLGYKYGF